EVEPKLKYERISNDVNNILSKDAASCLSVHPKFLALGTHWGMIHILDHIGNNVKGKEVQAHTTTVNQISIDDRGDYIASCSDDGRVTITGLYTADNNQSLALDRPVKAVALDPFFFKSGRGRHFVTGDEKLIMNEKGFLNRHKTYILHQGEGPIRNIKWKSDFIAWSNEQGVKVYDMSSKSRITHITKDHDYRPEMFGCHLFWKDDRTLLIGWGDRIKICVVRDQVKKDARELPTRYVEIVCMFTTEFYICGIAPLEDNIVVLTYEKESQQEEVGRAVAARPHLQILEPHMEYYEEISNDALSIRGFTEYRCNDYNLECIPEENLFYILSPKDIVVAKLRDLDDNITWLLEHEMFEEAMAAATQHEKELKKHTYQGIGQEYLHYLLEEEQYDEAGVLCIKILGKKKDLWEDQVYKFAKIKQLKAIAPYLPRGDPKLSPAIYEMVLNEFLQTDYEVFYKLIKEWPQDLYNLETIENASFTLSDWCLIVKFRILSIVFKKRNNTLNPLIHKTSFTMISFRLQHKDVFQLIKKHNLFDSINDKIVQLMHFDQDQAVKMLLDNMDKIPVEKVVHQLDLTPRHLHAYLDQLIQKDNQASQPYHGRMVKLYAEFDQPKLLSFLRTSQSYPLQMAMDECQTRDLVKEQVFLLGRMGNTKQALQLIMERVQDVNHAIEFCKEQMDEELWEDLLDYSMSKPHFMTALLQNVGSHIDPIKVITRIKKGIEIPELRDSLVKILQDYNLQISLREGCKKILVADSFNLMERLINTQKKGVFVEESTVCPICHQSLIINDLRYASNLAVFYCHHAFHEDCLPPNITNCNICHSQKRGPGSKEHFIK
ncbi:hypothetical protein LOTGIDRAFT_126722, partial [Lottia gigantea]